MLSRDEMGRILSLGTEDGDDIEIEGVLPHLYIPNREEAVNGGGLYGTAVQPSVYAYDDADHIL